MYRLSKLSPVVSIRHYHIDMRDRMPFTLAIMINQDGSDLAIQISLLQLVAKCMENKQFKITHCQRGISEFQQHYILKIFHM
jgi:hypothetical protein